MCSILKPIHSRGRRASQCGENQVQEMVVEVNFDLFVDLSYTSKIFLTQILWGVTQEFDLFSGSCWCLQRDSMMLLVLQGDSSGHSGRSPRVPSELKSEKLFVEVIEEKLDIGRRVRG